MYAYEEENSTNGRRELSRPMSKREFYESIINFRTKIDTALDIEEPNDTNIP